MSAFAVTFESDADLARYLGLELAQLPRLGVLLDRWQPGRALDPADLALLRGQARHIRESRATPPRLPQRPKGLRNFKGMFD